MLRSLNVRSAIPYDDRPYEWVTAYASFAVSPDQPGVVDLALAPRDEDGAVSFDSDVQLLRPTSGGNGRALLVVPNRGLLGGVPFGAAAGAWLDAEGPPAAGDGFLLDQGWTIAWCGWQWDVQRGPGRLGLGAPVADVEPGWLRLEFRPDQRLDEHALSDSGPLFRFAEYPAAGEEGVLTVRTTPMGPKATIPRQRWRFTSPNRVALDGGFQPFHWYELIYRSAYAPVVGTGLLALRDFGAYLQNDHEHVFAYGVSQCGRLLREFLHQGLNVDETGRQVFDGVFAHLASARRGEFNRRYGQPSLTHPLTPEYGPPYDTTSLLARQRALGGVPKVILTNSSWEYWRGDGALVHQDAVTGADLPEDPDARAHLLAGTDHLGPIPGLKERFPVANPVNTLDASLLLRALLGQLVEWVCQRREPAPSQVPRQADGTATTREKVLTSFPDAALPGRDELPWTPVLEPDTTTWPLELGEPLVALVSDVDKNGNERAGIRLPVVVAGVAAYTGWNPRKHVEGLPDVLYEMMGSEFPRNPRDETRLRAAAEALVRARFLRPEDVERAISGG